MAAMHRSSVKLIKYNGPSKPVTLYGSSHSMSSLARKAGCSVTLVSLIFRRKRRPSDATLRRFARALRVPSKELAAALSNGRR